MSSQLLSSAHASLSQIKLWNTDSLKSFCRRKGLKVKGSKEELVARVFAGTEQELPDVLTPKEELQAKAKSYQSLLRLSNGTILPDPFCDVSLWMSEDVGRKLWPPTMYGDICEYFHKLSGSINTSVTKRVLNDYKEGKAYSYFDSHWLKEVKYSAVSDVSDYCILKAMCTPSQRINHTLHNTWVAINKKTGEIVSAYCTCFAGLGATCNHIAAILFKLDYYWRQGLTNKSCTDALCTWNKYGADKTVLNPTLAKDLCWRKPQFGMKACKRSDKSIDNSKAFSFDELKKALLPVCPDAVVFQGHKDVSPNDIYHVDVQTSAPPPLCDLLNNCSSESDITAVFDSYKDSDVALIMESTQGQSDNDLWGVHRKYRITASFVHDVYTKVNTIKASKNVDSVNSDILLKKILSTETLDYKKIPQLKYGLEMEGEAKKSYKKHMQSCHLNFQLSETGLVIHKEQPQYGASPDGLVSCSCCLAGLVEIKCPMSVSHTKPSHENLPYLTVKEFNCSLKTTHRYFSQIQWQMGICNKSWCDFFVFTRHGHFLERVNFNLEHFTCLLKNCNFFYTKYVIPAILNGAKSDLDNTENTSAETVLTKVKDTQVTPVTPPNKKIKTLSSEMPIYICEICSDVCLSEWNIEKTEDNSVLCDNCLLWFHFKCVHFIDNGEKDWLCPRCKQN